MSRMIRLNDPMSVGGKIVGVSATDMAPSTFIHLLSMIRYLRVPRFLYLILIAFGLSGCFEVVPQRAEERIVIHRDGTYQLTYSGTFRSISKTLEDDPKKIAALEEETLQKLKRLEFVRLAKRAGPHLFSIRVEESGKLGVGEDDSVPELFGGKEEDSEIIPMLIGFNRVRELEQGYESNPKIPAEQKDIDDILSDSSPEGKRISRLFDNVDATLTIEIDASQVGEHNAQSQKKGADGKTIYTWRFNRHKLAAAEFTFFFGKADHLMFKVLRSPDGTNCRELIGQNCKCGPFVLYKMQTGDPIPNRAYTIRTASKSVEGCSNSEGETQIVESAVTGRCDLIVPPPVENEKRCGVVADE